MAGKKQQIKIRECDIPQVEFQVMNNKFQPIGTYNLTNFVKKYRGY